MKKFFRISLCIILALATCVGLVACDNGGGSDSDKAGMTVRKIDGEYIVKDYAEEKDANGNVKTELVIDGASVVGEGYNADTDVIKIGAGAFADNESLTKITITSDVSEIGAGAFKGMTALKELVLPFVGATEDAAVNEKRLFGYLFGTESYEEGRAVTQVVDGTVDADGSTSNTYYIPATLTTVEIKYEGDNAEGYAIPRYAFNGVDGAFRTVKLSGNIVAIGDAAFKNSTVKNLGVLNTVSGKYEVPATIKTIGDQAFYNCVNFKEVVFAEDSVLESIGDEAFLGFKGTNFDFPTTVTSLGARAFASVGEYTSKLKTVNTLANITFIGDYAFYNAEDFESYRYTLNSAVTNTTIFIGTIEVAP